MRSTGSVFVYGFLDDTRWTKRDARIHTSHEGILDYDNSIRDTMQKLTKRGVLAAFHEMVYRANKWSTYCTLRWCIATYLTCGTYVC